MSLRALAAASPDSQIIHTLNGCAADAADHREAVFANQGVVNGHGALGAVERRGSRGGAAGRIVGHVTIIALLLASLPGCLRIQTAEPAIGVAYVAPASLEVREEIAPRAKRAAELKHGDRVEVLARRRRFAKVRVPLGGAAGWTDGRQLLSPPSMELLRAETERGAKAAAQGTAKAVDVLNVHITPHRGSPSFYQLSEGERVTLIARTVLPRMQYVPPGEESGQLVTPATLRDDWSFVRLDDHRRCGWVLTGMLMPDLPLEILQLADGHRITAFFTLGQTAAGDDGKQRPVYLWTTSAAPPEQFQFDSFRVLAWSNSKQRYETTYFERNLEGFHPVAIVAAAGHSASTVQLVYASAPGEGVERHTFEFRDRKLKRLAREPWMKPEQGRPRFAEPLPDAPPPAGLWARTAEWWSNWRGR